MPQTIDVTGLDPEAVHAVETLVTVLRSRSMGSLSNLPPKLERLLDRQFHAECEADTSPEISLEEVRAGLASIPGSMTADFTAEREER